jgi:hypothetical protein
MILQTITNKLFVTLPVNKLNCSLVSLWVPSVFQDKAVSYITVEYTRKILLKDAIKIYNYSATNHIIWTNYHYSFVILPSSKYTTVQNASQFMSISHPEKYCTVN